MERITAGLHNGHAAGLFEVDHVAAVASRDLRREFGATGPTLSRSTECIAEHAQTIHGR